MTPPSGAAGAPRLRGAERTLLATLALRAADARSRHPILGDQWAPRVLADLGGLPRALQLLGGDEPVVVTRARLIDDRVRAFVREHPDAVVLHLACGLDSRAWRVDPPAGVAWYDVDRPAVVALRRRVYPERDGVRLVSAQVTEPGWGRRHGVPTERPTLVVAEGLLMYLSPDEVAATLVEPLHHLAGDVPLTWVADTAAAWIAPVTRWTTGLVPGGFRFRSATADATRALADRDATRLVERVDLAAAAHDHTSGLVRLGLGVALRMPGVPRGLVLSRWRRETARAD